MTLVNILILIKMLVTTPIKAEKGQAKMVINDHRDVQPHTAKIAVTGAAKSPQNQEVGIGTPGRSRSFMLLRILRTISIHGRIKGPKASLINNN